MVPCFVLFYEPSAAILTFQWKLAFQWTETLFLDKPFIVKYLQKRVEETTSMYKVPICT